MTLFITFVQAENVSLFTKLPYDEKLKANGRIKLPFQSGTLCLKLFTWKFFVAVVVVVVFNLCWHDTVSESPRCSQNDISKGVGNLNYK